MTYEECKNMYKDFDTEELRMLLTESLTFGSPESIYSKSAGRSNLIEMLARHDIRLQHKERLILNKDETTKTKIMQMMNQPNDLERIVKESVYKMKDMRTKTLKMINNLYDDLSGEGKSYVNENMKISKCHKHEFSKNMEGLEFDKICIAKIDLFSPFEKQYMKLVINQSIKELKEFEENLK